MRTYDFTPLFRSSVGFDRWSELFDAASRADDSAAGYPPYNIEKMGDDKYRIMMAVAGFGENDVEITAQENLLVVSGNLGEPREGVTTYLYRGIATRAFQRRFSLADHVKVVGATLADGVLQVDLERELPEAMKPRRITVESKRHSGTSPNFSVRPDGAHHQWRKVPPRELSVWSGSWQAARLGNRPRRSLATKAAFGRLSDPAGRNASEA